MFDEYGNINWRKVLFILGIALLVISLGWYSIDQLSLRNVPKRLADDQQLANQVAGKVRQARAMIEDNTPLYAGHWFASESEQLHTAETLISDMGDIYVYLRSASEALAGNDRRTARTFAAHAEQLIQDAEKAANAILGPPNMFVKLADWASRADGTIVEAQSCIEVNRIEIKIFEHSQNYQRGLDDLTRAQELLNQAIVANTIPVERGIIDKPQAYLYADNAWSSCRQALLDAAPPTPTPIPSPTETPLPTSDSSLLTTNNDSDDSGGWDFGGDSGGWDSGGSDDGGWDSGGGDSGSWDSGGGDSGSWDDGSSDGYDDGGSDDSSWDDPDW